MNALDAARVRELVKGAGELCSSMWCVPEVSCAFQRHVREGSLDRDQVAGIRQKFLDSRREGVWTLFPVTDELLYRMEERVRDLPPGTYLRAGDAIHLVTAQRAGFTEIWSNDRHLLRAASLFGLTGRSV